MPFLTDLDSRAAVKGSRDPLGIQPLWDRLGRYVVGNLTTVSNSVTDFTVLLLGFHFVERVAREKGPQTELATFLKWEQLAAFARASVNEDWTFRGRRRVLKNLNNGRRVSLGADLSHQILANQRTYGLWGLYRVPARSSALLEGDPMRLTHDARELIDKVFLPMLGRRSSDVDRVVALLAKDSFSIDVKGSDRGLLDAVAIPLRPKLPRRALDAYRFHLLNGGPQETTEGRQEKLVELLKDTLDAQNFTWRPSTLVSLARRAQAKGKDWHSLAYRLNRIRVAECVFAPVAALFSHLLGLDGKKPSVVVQRLKAAWGPRLATVDPDAFEDLRNDLDYVSTEEGRRWIHIARAAATGDYQTLLDQLLEQNSEVMKRRGGTPWVESGRAGLRVHFREETGELPTRKSIPGLWWHSYFLNALRQVAGTLRRN